MSGITNLKTLIRNMKPELHSGVYVFVTVKSLDEVSRATTVFEFKEEEGVTIVLEKAEADALNLSYQYVACWITLKVHSSLEAVGLTAAFSTELAQHNISCNVVAGYYHDHIFVDQKDGQKTVSVLTKFSEMY